MPASKMTYSLPIVWQPDQEGVTSKQIATSGREITNCKLIASGAAATVYLYDTNNSEANYSQLRWVFDSSTQFTDSDTFTFPLFFKKGIYAVLTQGAGFNAILCLSIIPDQV